MGKIKNYILFKDIIRLLSSGNYAISAFPRQSYLDIPVFPGTPKYDAARLF
jgi:hypothetical protein